MIEVLDRVRFLEMIKMHLTINPIGVELGVYMGDFSHEILKVLEPGELTLVDPYERGGSNYGEALEFSPTAYSTEDQYQELFRRFSKQVVSGQVKVRRQYSYDAVKYFKDNSLDFFYLDASHLFPDVKRDLNDWVKKLKQKGLVLGHDYLQFDNFGVVPAVDEFCKEHSFEMIIFNRNGGDFALKRK